MTSERSANWLGMSAKCAGRGARCAVRGAGCAGRGARGGAGPGFGVRCAGRESVAADVRQAGQDLAVGVLSGLQMHEMAGPRHTADLADIVVVTIQLLERLAAVEPLEVGVVLRVDEVVRHRVGLALELLARTRGEIGRAHVCTPVTLR